MIETQLETPSTFALYVLAKEWIVVERAGKLTFVQKVRQLLPFSDFLVFLADHDQQWDCRTSCVYFDGRENLNLSKKWFYSTRPLEVLETEFNSETIVILNLFSWSRHVHIATQSVFPDNVYEKSINVQNCQEEGDKVVYWKLSCYKTRKSHI